MQVERPRVRGAFCVGEGCERGGLPVCGSRGRAFCAGERFAGCRLASSDIALRFATSPDNLQRFLEVATKKNASVCKTSAASPSTSRNCRSCARLTSKTTQSKAHPGRTARTRAFFGSRSAKPLSNSSSSHQPKSNPLANSSAAHRPNPDPLASTSPVHRPEPTLLPTTPPNRSPQTSPLPATLQVVAQPTALRIISPSQAPDQRLPAHRPKPAPYQQPFKPSDRFRPLTNTPLSHRPGVEGLHGAAPYCVCATPSPSGAPIARGLSPRCAPHRPSSIRS